MDTVDHLLEALAYTGLGTALIALVVAVAWLLNIGSTTPQRHGIER